MTDIYLTISLSIHNGDDTPQNVCGALGGNPMKSMLVETWDHF